MKLIHNGIKGMHWGVRRFQYEDGSLTPAGRERYGVSLTNNYSNSNEDDDYILPKNSFINRRIDSRNDNYNFSEDDKYTYTYDYDNDKDNNFYKQFGNKVLEYSINDDVKLAGLKSSGKTFVDTILKQTDEEVLENVDIFYEEVQKRHGVKNIESLLAQPLNTSALEKYGGELGSKLISLQRHDAFDEKMKKRGMRDVDTSANDVGRMFVSDLLNKGYGGIRDYNDYGSNADVLTPTVLFEPDKRLKLNRSWIDD